MPEEGIIIARGEIEPADLELACRLLSRIGLNATRYNPDTYADYIRAQAWQYPVEDDESRRLTLSFNEITSREQFIVREHFEEFRLSSFPAPSLQAVSRAFNYCVDAGGGVDRQWDIKKQRNIISDGEPKPLEGMVVVNRAQAKLPEYRTNPARFHDGRNLALAKYAIQAGSLIDTAKDLSRKLSRDSKIGEVITKFTSQLAVQIK